MIRECPGVVAKGMHLWVGYRGVNGEDRECCHFCGTPGPRDPVSQRCDIEGCEKPAVGEREISEEYGMASLCEEHF